LKHIDWSQVPQEHLNEKLSRKFVTGEKVMVAQFFLKQGCLVPEHSHESEQMSFIVTGSLKFFLEGKELIVRSNELLNIPSNIKHSAEALEDTLAYDIFSPIRQDWIEGNDAYLRK
jgi:quercetin dioxygenase-like cupin family protein